MNGICLTLFEFNRFLSLNPLRLYNGYKDIPLSSELNLNEYFLLLQMSLPNRNLKIELIKYVLLCNQLKM